MGKTQHVRVRNKYDQSPESAYDEYVQRVHENKRVRRKKKSDTPTTAPFQERSWDDWVKDCYQWRGMLLEGRYAHWCINWNLLPVDETCPEWPCGCNIIEEVNKNH